MATPFLQAACLSPRRERVQTMRRVLRVSPLPNRAFDIFRLRQLGFRSGDSAPLEGSFATETRRFVLIWFDRGAGWPTVASLPPSGCVAPGDLHDGADGGDHAKEEGCATPGPPWGKLFGGKPTGRHIFIRDERIDLNDEFLRERQ